MKTAVFHRLAREELDAAIQWHEQRTSGLGLSLLEEVRRSIGRIQRNLQSSERYKKTDFKFALVRRFPYVVFFLEQVDSIWIVAIAHAHRRPGYWRHRKPH